MPSKVFHDKSYYIVISYFKLKLNSKDFCLHLCYFFVLYSQQNRAFRTKITVTNMDYSTYILQFIVSYIYYGN